MNKFLLALLLAYAPLIFADYPALDSDLVQKCGACHGIDGNSPLPIVPNLAGQLSGYLLYELQAYKKHDRVDKFMGAIIDPIPDDDIAKLAIFYSKQKLKHSTPPEPLDPTLVAKGKLLYNTEIPKLGLSCADCHGDRAEGVANPKEIKDFPRLAGQQYDYLLSNLQEYANRMKDHSLLGMRAVAATLTNDTIKALAAYLSSLE